MGTRFQFPTKLSLLFWYERHVPNSFLYLLSDAYGCVLSDQAMPELSDVLEGADGFSLREGWRHLALKRAFPGL